MVSIVQVMKPLKPIGFPSPLAHEFLIDTFRHLKPIVMKEVPISKNAPFIHQLSRRTLRRQKVLDLMLSAYT
jgi:hypothetical protein